MMNRWESRSLFAHLKDPRDQAMYAVLHGGIDRNMRQLSIDYLTQLPFDGLAIGMYGPLNGGRANEAEYDSTNI